MYSKRQFGNTLVYQNSDNLIAGLFSENTFKVLCCIANATWQDGCWRSIFLFNSNSKVKQLQKHYEKRLRFILSDQFGDLQKDALFQKSNAILLHEELHNG